MKIRFADARALVPSFVCHDDGLKVIHKPSGVKLDNVMLAHAEEGYVIRLDPAEKAKGNLAEERIDCAVDIIVSDEFASKPKVMEDIMAGVFFDHDLTEDERIAREKHIMGEEVTKKVTFDGDRSRQGKSYFQFVYDLTGKVPVSMCTPKCLQTIPQRIDVTVNVSQGGLYHPSLELKGDEKNVMGYVEELDFHFSNNLYVEGARHCDSREAILPLQAR